MYYVITGPADYHAESNRVANRLKALQNTLIAVWVGVSVTAIVLATRERASSITIICSGALLRFAYWINERKQHKELEQALEHYLNSLPEHERKAAKYEAVVNCPPPSSPY